MTRATPPGAGARMRERAARRMLIRIDVAAGCFWATGAVDAFDPSGRPAVRCTSAAQVHHQIVHQWCAGDAALADRVLAQAYMRYLPMKIARVTCRVAFQLAGVLACVIAIRADLPNVVKVLACLAWLMVAVCAAFMARPPKAVLNLVVAGRGRSGLLDDNARERLIRRHWRDLGAGAVTARLLAPALQASRVAPEVQETALGLLEDGWTGTCGELVRTAQLL